MTQTKTLYFSIVVGALAVLATSPALASTEKVIWRFNGTDGYRPVGALVMDSSGNLYGVTNEGGAGASGDAGVVFRLEPDSKTHWKETVVHNFCSEKGCADGVGPYDSLTMGSDGALYGTTWEGGARGAGVVYRLALNAKGKWVETVLHDFGSGNDGASPLSGVTFDAAGNLYGATYYGGKNSCRYGGDSVGCGTVYELSPGQNGKWTEKVLYNFQQNGTDGFFPDSRLIFDASGNLYGTDTAGGSGGCPVWGCGTVFEVTPGVNGAWTEATLHSFDDTDGNEASNLVMDASGNLYGATIEGGPTNGGVIYELSPGQGGQWVENIVRNFYKPHGPVGVIFDAFGNLYGTTEYGGKYSQNYECGGCGTALELSPGANGWTETLLHSFGNGEDGAQPEGNLMFDSAGNLYGVTYQGGISTENCLAGGCGTVYEITP
jgi:uncharacterized repeat protein (TIGR03803 family)